MENLTIHDAPGNEEASVFATLNESAEIEFQTCLQLLAERAMFLLGATSVAVALKNSQGLAAYVAVAGATDLVCGTDVAADDEFATSCLKEAKVAQRTVEAASDKHQLLVPVMRDGECIGLFRLASRFEFQEVDVKAIERLAELATVADEHKSATAELRARLFERSSAIAASATVRADAPGVQDSAQSDPAEPDHVAVPSFATCSSCGFPVSAARNLCVECEQKTDPAVVKPAELFAVAKSESWISAYGYTIASAIVTVLAVAIILWLRR